MNQFKFDIWTLWGLTAQGFYFARFVLQWVQSERQGKIVIPHVFWILSLIGAVMIIVYSLVRSDLVLLITGLLQLVLFSRSLILSKKLKKII